MEIDLPAMIGELMASSDHETILRQHLSALIAQTQAAAAAGDRGAHWQPGEPLRLFLAGYNGGGNTGADLRVFELIRQLRHLLGPQVDPGVMVSGASAGEVFVDTRLEEMDTYLPVALWQKVRAHHGVIASEGSMFKSNFSELLSVIMTAGLGLAVADQKLAVAYGGEAGAMSPDLTAFVQQHARGAWLVCRSESSVQRLRDLGLPAERGVDTAWTWSPPPSVDGAAPLRAAGWDEQRPAIAFCPVNPFWWPVTPDPARAAAMEADGSHAEDHYGGGLFHRRDATTDVQVNAYLDGLAKGVRAARAAGAMVLIVGMERLDRDVCVRLADRVGGAPLLLSGEASAPQIAATLRVCAGLVSSRFHALVLAAPAGVPAVGVSFDERIENLLRSSGQPELLLGVRDPDLGARVAVGISALLTDREARAHRLRRFAGGELRALGDMGRRLVAQVRAHHPEFPAPDLGADPLRHLPPLAPALQPLLDL